MRWLDVAGVPSSGKSTLCYAYWKDKEVTTDGLPPPPYWRPLIEQIKALLPLVEDHVNPAGRPTIQNVIGMNRRSLLKMAAVERMPDERPGDPRTCFIQTGLTQRGLGFGWRLVQLKRDLNLIRPFFWVMPVSVGVVFLELSVEEAMRRNRARLLDPATAHEDRSYQIEATVPAIALAKEVLRERGVAVIEIDVEHQSIDQARQQLLHFADPSAGDSAASRSGGEGPVLPAPA